MADRIIAMREKLYNLLIELKTPGEWGHIKSQIGTSIAPLFFLFFFFFCHTDGVFRHVLFHRYLKRTS